MKRQKKPCHSTAAYPDLKAFVKRYRRRAACGLVAGVVTTSTGCDWFKTGTLDPKPPDDTGTHLDGMGAETAETWSLTLPLEGLHELYFESPWGWVQFRVGLLVDRQGLWDWLNEHPDAALAAVDEALLGFGIALFEADDGFEEVEAAIAVALDDLYQQATGDGQAGFLEVYLAIEGYQDEDDVPGDVAVPLEP